MATENWQPAQPLQPVIDPAGWGAAEIAAGEEWVYRFPEHEIAEIMDAAEKQESGGRDLVSAGREDFALPKTQKIFAAIYEELKSGRGFVSRAPLDAMEAT